MPIIRMIRVFENETVEIQWTRRDGSVYIERKTIPPTPTVDVRMRPLDLHAGEQ